MSAIPESVSIVIPARMGSSRFPGKPLVPILGIPMVEHVRRRCMMVEGVDDVIVATCDQEIVDVVTSAGGRCVMTSASHVRASDRVAEAAGSLGSSILVMVQGDEPTIQPPAILEALGPMRGDPELGCVNLMARIGNVQDFMNPDVIKVVSDVDGNALFMTRQPIPHGGPDVASAFKQVCVIPFRRQTLARFALLPPTPLEVAESIDMLRLIEHGLRVRMVRTEQASQAVDRPEDLPIVEDLLRGDPLTHEYLQAPERGRGDH